MTEKVTPGQKRLQRRKREAQFGLANNAFGATAGAVATAQAYRSAPKTKADMQATRTGRFLLRRRINPKVAIPAAGTALVGMQLVNGAMDAQSAQYFGRELKTIHGKEKRMEARLAKPAGVAKSYEELTVGGALPESDGIGRSLELVEKGLPSALRAEQRLFRTGANASPSRFGRKHRINSGKATTRDQYIANRIAAARHGREASRWSDNMKGMRRHDALKGENSRSVSRAMLEASEASSAARANNRYAVLKGMSLVEVSKKARRFDPEADRQRRLGAYQGAGTAGAIGLTAAGVKAMRDSGLTLKELAKLNKYKLGGGLLLGGAASGAVAIGAQRRASSARNERWT